MLKPAQLAESSIPLLRRTVLYAALAAGCLPTARVTAQGLSADRDEIVWRTGADFQKQLEVVASVQWRRAELRERLENLAAVHRVAIFLDRRIDPQQQLDFSSTGAPLELLLGQLARQLNAATAQIGPVIYIGPPRAAGAVAAVAAQRRRDLGKRGSLSRRRPLPWNWPMLAEPRQLLLDLAGEQGLVIANPDLIPHDLWPAVDLPPLELADRLTLLLVGFDLTFERDGASNRLKLVPLPTDAEYEQSYPLAGDADELVSALKRDHPKLMLRRDGNRLIVRGKYADHQRIVSRISGSSTGAKGASPDNTRFTLTVRNESAGAVVSTVARRLGKQLQVAPDVRERLAGKVSFVVHEATLDALMEKTLGPLGLTYRLTEETIEVLEKE